MATEAEKDTVSVACEAGETREMKGWRWAKENKEAMLAWNRWIEEYGLPLEEYRKF